MDGCRKALYTYSWKQSPINKHRRVNSSEEEKKIFDGWFEEKADEYFPWIKSQGPDPKTMLAKTSWTSWSPPCSPKICKSSSHVSSAIEKRLKNLKQDQKTHEEMRKETDLLANLTRYERSLKETRKAIDEIKKERQRKQFLYQAHNKKLSYSATLPENSASTVSRELPSFQKSPRKEKAGMKCSSSGLKKLKESSKSGPILSSSKTSCDSIEKHAEQTKSSDSTQRTPEHHSDYYSDNELLRLALESSPVQKSDSVRTVTARDDELSDEALLALLTSSPVSSAKLKKNKLSTKS